MNLAIRGIDFNLGREPAGPFTRHQHADLRADYIRVNPPFNISDWWHGRLEGDPRWVCGDPPQGNANDAWLLHMLHHLKDCGRAGIVLANGSMSNSQNNEGAIRAAMIEADVVDVVDVNYQGQPGFCRSVALAEIAQRGLMVATRDTSPFEAAELNTINPWEAAP